MKKTILVLMFLGFTLISNAQSAKLDNKWYSTAEVEFILPYKLTYSYFIGNTITFNDIQTNGGGVKIIWCSILL